METKNEDQASPRVGLEAQPKPHEYHQDLGPVTPDNVVKITEADVNEGAARPDSGEMKAMEPPRGDESIPDGNAKVDKPRRRRMDSFRT